MTKDHPQNSDTQQDIAGFAMDLKQAAEKPERPDPGQTADEGMNALPNGKIAASGALHAEGQRPVLERSRKVR